MERRILILLFCIAMTYKVSIAQTENDSSDYIPPSFLRIGIGSALPIGNLSTTSVATNHGYGFALPGQSFTLEGAYFFSKYVGVGGVLIQSVLGMDEKAFEQSIKAFQPAITDITNASAPWRISVFGFGLYGDYPLSKKTSLTAKVLITSMSLSREKSILTVNSNPSNPSQGVERKIEMYDKAASIFGNVFGAGARYLFSPRLGASANLDFSFAAPIAETTDLKNGASKQYGVPSHTMFFTIGFNYMLKKQDVE